MMPDDGKRESQYNMLDSNELFFNDSGFGSIKTHWEVVCMTDTMEHGVPSDQTE